MQTDFATVRLLLETTLTHVQGADKTSAQVREALELLIEAVRRIRPRKRRAARQPSVLNRALTKGAHRRNCTIGFLHSCVEAIPAVTQPRHYPPGSLTC